MTICDVIIPLDMRVTAAVIVVSAIAIAIGGRHPTRTGGSAALAR